MGRMKIELRSDPQTGVREIVVHLDKDDELLPHEHEELHRKLVEQLFGLEAVSEQPLPQLRISRSQDEAGQAEDEHSEQQSNSAANDLELGEG